MGRQIDVHFQRNTCPPFIDNNSWNTLSVDIFQYGDGHYITIVAQKKKLPRAEQCATALREIKIRVPLTALWRPPAWKRSGKETIFCFDFFVAEAKWGKRRRLRKVAEGGGSPAELWSHQARSHQSGCRCYKVALACEGGYISLACLVSTLLHSNSHGLGIVVENHSTKVTKRCLLLTYGPINLLCCLYTIVEISNVV